MPRICGRRGLLERYQHKSEQYGQSGNARTQAYKGYCIQQYCKDPGITEWQNNANVVRESLKVTLDLNGHKLTHSSDAGTLFEIENGGTLIVKDSQKEPVSRTKDNSVVIRKDNSDARAENGTGIALPASFSNGTLTYYVTESTINVDKLGTTEQRYKVTAPINGEIDANGALSPVFTVKGNHAVLAIEGV